MKQLSTYGKLGFPHFTNFELGKITKRYCGTFSEWNEKKGCKENVEKYMNVMEDGTYDFICSPDNTFIVGDTFMHPYYKIIQYKITGIVEEREAKGEWSNLDFKPIFQKCTVSITQ